MKIEEIRHVNVLHTELVRFTTEVSTARRVIIDLYPLHLEPNVSVLHASIKLCIAVDEVDGGDVMCDERENFLFGFFVDDGGSVGIVVLEKGGGKSFLGFPWVLNSTHVWNGFPDVPPNQRIRLNVQRARVALLEPRRSRRAL